jgi:hypothetical protein
MPMKKPISEPLRKAYLQSFMSCQVGSRFFRPLGTGSMSSGFSGSMLDITSPTAKMPMATMTNSMPPSSSVWPKVKREVAVNRSVPMLAIHRPTIMDSKALVSESPASSTTIVRPSTMRAKYSGALKASVSLASGGATSISSTVPMVPAMNEAMALMPSAAPARPLRAIW